MDKCGLMLKVPGGLIKIQIASSCNKLSALTKPKVLKYTSTQTKIIGSIFSVQPLLVHISLIYRFGTHTMTEALLSAIGLLLNLVDGTLQLLNNIKEQPVCAVLELI